jgi:hypothetical protein
MGRACCLYRREEKRREEKRREEKRREEKRREEKRREERMYSTHNPAQIIQNKCTGKMQNIYQKRCN